MKKEQLKQLAADMLAGGMSVTDAKAALIRLDPNSSKQIKKFMKDPSFTNKFTIDVSSEEDDEIVERTVINGVEEPEVVEAEIIEETPSDKKFSKKAEDIIAEIEEGVLNHLKKIMSALGDDADDDNDESPIIEVKDPANGDFDFAGFDNLDNLMNPEWVQKQPFSTYTIANHPDLLCESFTIHGPLYDGTNKNTHLKRMYVRGAYFNKRFGNGIMSIMDQDFSDPDIDVDAVREFLKKVNAFNAEKDDDVVEA